MCSFRHPARADSSLSNSQFEAMMTTFFSRSRQVLPPLAMAGLIAGGSACTKAADNSTDSSAAAAALPAAGDDQQKALMDSGTTLLYTRKDANAAAAVFADLLKLNPNHYGAHYQIAVALDSAGRVADATNAWQQFVPLAEASKDDKSLATARARLANPPVQMTDAQVMNLGMYTMYTKNDAAGAEPQFRELLKRNATHYGATYQLATSLDRQNKPAEARPLWQKVLVMAQNVKDSATIKTAAARLARNP
jgi:cytochrome c-type biogenesis protein CcmH/NrfG